MQLKQPAFDIKVQANATNPNVVSIHIEGELSFTTVPVAYEQTRHCFDRGQHIQVDLNDVERADSAAMALILEWHRLAKKQDVDITLFNVPLILKNIANVTGLNILMP